MSRRFTPLQYGVDDITLGFDMSGSGAIACLNEVPYRDTMRGRMLGYPASYGAWVHYLGRSVSFWKPDTRRLYVQAKLAPQEQLCPPQQVIPEVEAMKERMAFLGLMSREEPWVTRLDVAVDASCSPADGKLLLDGLAAARPPNGWRTTVEGTPMSTVYFRSRASQTVVARSYCRNLKLRMGEPFGLIRLEAADRFKPRELMLEAAGHPNFAAQLWESRFVGLASRVRRLGRERQAEELSARMVSGELRHGEAERLHLFLDLERLGLAEGSYRKPVYAQRRREAARLGYGSNDPCREPVEVELAELLAPYVGAVREGVAA